MGSDVRLVINHADAALYIHPPMLDTTVAVQMTAYARWRNGAQGSCAAFIFRTPSTRIPSRPRILDHPHAVSCADGRPVRGSNTRSRDDGWTEWASAHRARVDSRRSASRATSPASREAASERGHRIRRSRARHGLRVASG